MLETRDLTKVYNESVLGLNKLNLKVAVFQVKTLVSLIFLGLCTLSASKSYL